MSSKLKSAPLWAAILTLIYLILKNWVGFEIPAWNDISAQIIAVLTIVFDV